MSKKFKSQDYFRYKKLGTRWRRPKGHQSKLRKKKAGAGLKVSIGYRTPRDERNKYKGMHFVVVRSMKDLENAKEAVFIASTVGAKNAEKIYEKAKELKLTVLNMKKIKRARKIRKAIESKQKKKEEKKAKEKKKKEEQKETEKKKSSEKKDEVKTKK